ncbi:MAG: hypothetical protein KDH20_02030 [Rhodocyclaceae bacterium]|nr:hypothetical protein [Gammaproteobacteria bacterium]MCB1886361.1 hypothetical protein [Rhodocyclaceae bacterium]
MNWPLDKIHDPLSSYGRLLIPLGRGRWLAWFRRYGFCRTDKIGFHNCTRSGVH